MNTAKIKQSIDTLLAAYHDRLAQIPDDLFTQTPTTGGWSYAEVYAHVLQACYGSLVSIQKCASGTGEFDNKGTAIAARLVLWAGRFPPGKIKAPKHIAALVTKMSKPDVLNLFDKVTMRLNDVLTMVAHAQRTSKFKHPRLGLLNAPQWLRFIEIHTRHHLKQLKRLDINFGIG